MRWVLVAGTGRQYGLRECVGRLASQLGRSLSDRGFGLVVGGWPGVDHLASKGFAERLRARRAPLSDYLIQVVASKRPSVYPADASYPDFAGGHVITVQTGTREWIEALKYAHAVLLVEGEGGTKETFYYANQEQRPVFPFAASGGDAAGAYREALQQWDALPYDGLNRDEFQRELSGSIDDHRSCYDTVEAVLSLVSKRLQYEESRALRSGPLVFVSYAHEDATWLLKVRSALRPLERVATLSVWDDRSIRPGDAFGVMIERAIASSRVAVLLVSDAFLESDFIRTVELPRLLSLHQQRRIQVLWLPLSGTRWKESPLAEIKAAHDVDQPLASLSEAAQQDELVRLRTAVAEALRDAALKS